ncbi:MAG: AlkA N-terminal domain-containing protein [Ilumatobacteraceae bacterium]
MALDDDRCYRAAQSRDARFDGWFYVAVRTTGIYCRPSCPAVTPKRSNVEFHRSAAAAQQRGFRACKRCRPDASPGSPEWDLRRDLVARAMRSIADGVVDRDGVEGLARRLGYSSRHLHRLLVDELGAGPLALARAQRAQTARILIETSDMTMTDIAFAAGFGSVRQFNDTIREVFAVAPSALRRPRRREQPIPGQSAAVSEGDAGSVSVRLATRAPFSGHELLDFIGAHAAPGLEHWDGVVLHRHLDLPHGHGAARLVAAESHIDARLRLRDWRDLAPAVQRIRRWLDLDADPVAIDATLGSDPLLAPMIETNPGLRSPGSIDPFEAAIRTIIGQQVSVAGAATVTGRIVGAFGAPFDLGDGSGDTGRMVFPRPERLAELDPLDLPIPRQRGATLIRLATAVADGVIDLSIGADRPELTARLGEMKGIGPWTIRHIEMRGFGDPDVWLDGDLIAKRALVAVGLDPSAPDRWRPWRSYAQRHLWNHVWRTP